MRLLLIRHAESEGNAEGRFQGQRDFPLSSKGVEQALRLAAALKERPIDHIYASPLDRANHTARLVAEIKKMPVRSLSGVMEYDFGDFSGMSWAEIAELRPDLAEAQRGRGRYYVPWPGEEGRDAFRDRVCRTLWALEPEHKDETIAVFSHGGVIAVFCQAVFGISPHHRPTFMVDNTSIFEVEVRDGKGVIHTTNDTCHLHA